MTDAAIAEAAALFAAARRSGTRIAALPASCAPKTVAAAHAIQDETARLLGLSVAGWKVNAPPGGDVTRGQILAGLIHANPARVPAASVPQCGIEGEVAFRIERALPARAAAYSAEEVADAVIAMPAIEIVDSRFAAPDNAGALDKLADSISNGGFVAGSPLAHWRDLDLQRLGVTQRVNGAITFSGTGTHPIGDAFAPMLALANLLRESCGLAAGQIVTTGSWTGVQYLRPGDRCAVSFTGLGDVALEFTA
ncbi:MAG: fumarylacetoacetate hydrolase family protein [Rhodospirillales bacterium]|nr:fumarylacetoacetate hydrolase family protein [Rhodospirillales bacterium]